MSCRQIWEDIYAVEIFSSNTTLTQITGNPPALDYSTQGIKGRAGDVVEPLLPKYNILVDGSYPSLKAQNKTIEKNLATGQSMQNEISLTQVVSKPDSVVLPQVFNSHNLTAFLKLMFQSGATFSTGTANTSLQILTAVPFSDACPVNFGNLVRFRQDSDGVDVVDQVLHGIIPSRIMIKGEEGGLIEGEVEVAGAKWAQYDLSAKLDVATPFDSIPPLKFEDLKVMIDGVEISIPKFELTFTIGLSHLFYNQVAAQSVTLGRLNVECSLTVPWNDASVEGSNAQIVDFVAGTKKIVSLVWGNGSTTVSIGDSLPTISGGVDTLPANAKNNIDSNYFAVHALMRIMDYDEDDIEDNPMTTPKFKVLVDSQNTLSGITIFTGYDKGENRYGAGY